MIQLKSPKEIRRLRDAGRIVAETFEVLREAIRPGVSLAQLDRKAESYLRKQGATPLYKGYKGPNEQSPPFPGVICASVNEVICHGIPNERELQNGDIVSIDVGLKYRGYCGDACITFPVGEISQEAQWLLDVTQECLRIGINAAQPRGYLNDIGDSIQTYADSQGVSIVRELTGHGLGRQLHESPSVFHFRQDTRGPRMRRGMVFTIEPMINAGSHDRYTLNDGWTEVTKDGKLSAQFEHTIVIAKHGPEILSKL
ncbi:MAG: type I methionyl aminopeptidase [Ardenticatenaceae bacterium]